MGVDLTSTFSSMGAGSSTFFSSTGLVSTTSSIGVDLTSNFSSTGVGSSTFFSSCGDYSTGCSFYSTWATSTT